MASIVGLEPTYSRFLNSFKAPLESLNGILYTMARALSNSCLNRRIGVCLSRLSLKFLRDGSVNVGHLSNTAADFCSPAMLLHSSVGVGFPRSSDTAAYSRNEMGMVQPRLVENRVCAYKAHPQTVEDELDRKDTRLVPSCQCLSTVKRPTALLACVFSFHAVRKESL